MSREELLLNLIADQDSSGAQSSPMSRNEKILQAVINGISMSDLPTPQSREEKLLMDIGEMIQDGGGSSIENADSIEF